MPEHKSKAPSITDSPYYDTKADNNHVGATITGERNVLHSWHFNISNVQTLLFYP